MNKLEDLITKKTWNVMRGVAMGYPRSIDYYCRIHKQTETAYLIGLMEMDEDTYALYNTPRNHTLSHDTIVQLANGVWSDEEWKRYEEIREDK